MNFTHVKNKIFVVRSGFIVIGRRSSGELSMDRWAIDLRWRCPLLLVCNRLYYVCNRLYHGAKRPSKQCILLCAIFAPLLTGIQWLFLLVVWVVGLTYFLSTLVVGWLIVSLGRWLLKIGRLG